MTDTGVPSFGSEQFDRLALVNGLLTVKLREVGALASAEKEGRVTTHFRSQESSVSARDRDADLQVLGLSTDIIRLKNEVAALQNEQQFLFEWLAYERDRRYI